MNSIQQLLPWRYSLLQSTVTLRHNLKEWIRQEIVDDDPYDQTSLSDWLAAQQSQCPK